MATYNLTAAQLKEGGILNSFEIPAVGSFTNVYSVDFDGVDDYIDCGDNDNLSFGDGSTDSPFSISTWVKLNITYNSTSASLIEKIESTEYEFALLFYNSKIYFALYDSVLSTRVVRYYNTGLSSYSNQWLHICATYDGQGGSTAYNGMKVYLNGTQIDDTSWTTGGYTAMHNTSANVFMSGERYKLNGNLDEASIFNSELSASDITAIYNSGTPQSLDSYSSLVSWWRMGDGDTYPTLTDNGSGGNNGTMTNMVSGDIVTDVP